MARFLLALIVSSLAMGCATPPDLAAEMAPRVSVRYPLESTSLQMGQALKCIVEVRDAGGEIVPNARVVLKISDPSGEAVGSVDALIGSGDVYRSEGWTIPRLLAATEEAVRQAGGRMLIAETSGTGPYDGTRKFYIDTGYVMEATIKDFYVDGDDLAIFVKRFPQPDKS